MRCYRGRQEPKLRSKKADIGPDNVNLKLERADFRLERAVLELRLERLEDRFEAGRIFSQGYKVFFSLLTSV